VVEIQFRPWCLKVFDNAIMAVQKLPSGSDCAPRGGTDDRVADDTVGIRHKGSIVA